MMFYFHLFIFFVFYTLITELCLGTVFFIKPSQNAIKGKKGKLWKWGFMGMNSNSAWGFL